MVVYRVVFDVAGTDGLGDFRPDCLVVGYKRKTGKRGEVL